MVAGKQLSFDDEVSVGAGYRLLELLNLGGWSVVVTTPFAGQMDDGAGEKAGVLVIAEYGPFELKCVGESVAAVAPGLFAEARRLRRLPRLEGAAG